VEVEGAALSAREGMHRTIIILRGTCIPIC